MKVIGLLGGMSWESTAEYYRLINKEIHRRLGKVHSARIAMYSLDFQEVESLQNKGDWAKATHLMIDGATRVQNAGADFLCICTNTMHLMYDEVQKFLRIPVIHIADAIAQNLTDHGISKVGLLGTRFTMEKQFYRERLETNDLMVIVPDKPDRQTVHEVIYGELVKGMISKDSREKYKGIVSRIASEGAEAVILGCTEIGLLLRSSDVGVPLVDSTTAHAMAAVELALGEKHFEP